MAIETLTQTAAGPVRRLICSCCGAQTYGRQWHNRDIGYGLCRSCIPRALAAESRDRGPAEPVWYGVRGVHFDCPEEVAILAAEESRWQEFIANIEERQGKP